jgi:DNA polymerase III epsilon subunit-like protein
MEPMSAVELFKNAPKHGIKYSTYTGDDDSTTELYINQQVPYGVEKFSDIIHIKRSLTTRLYNLSKMAQFKDCSTLSTKVIQYLIKCFSIVVAQNKSDPEAMKSSLKCIVPHSFGDHSSCNDSWCRYKQDPTKYKHGHLPYGKDLHGKPLKSALEDIFSQYYSDIMIKKLAPATNSQRNESFNSTVGSKNPNIRYYGGSESNDFRVACAVAQTNIGYSYVCRTLEALGIDPGSNCTNYTCEMEKKKNNDVKRKNKISFKQRRNQLHNQRIQGTARKEKQEGKTYETNIGMSLEMPVSGATASESITGLVQLIKEDIEKETLSIYEETISPFTPRPNCPNIEFDSNMEYNIILFDVETNTTGKSAQLCQLSAVDKTGENCFSKYILPDNDIDKYATRVNKLTVKSVEGKRTLFKDDVPLQTLTCQEATSQFVNYIRSCIDFCKARTTNNYICTVLIGHNARRFDIPILLRNSTSKIHAVMQALGICFGDSLMLFEHLLRIKHSVLTLSNGRRCSSNQSSIYEALFEEKFAAHDAKEDVIALRRILFLSPINLTEQDIITQCKPISTCDALTDSRYLDKRYHLLQTMKYKLYSDVNSDQAPITKSMAEKIAGSGLSYDDLKTLFVHHGKKGLIAVLSKPSTISSEKKPRVTKTPRILASILQHFEQTSEQTTV